jgi:glucokinase
MDIAFIDCNGSILQPAERVLVPKDENGVADVERILDILAPFVERAKTTLSDFLGIGFSICGNIDDETGEAVLVANLHWHNMPFGKIAKERFDVPIYLGTDVRMALIAELLWGKARGYKYVAWMTLGTGYGGYLFLDGRLYSGSHGFAGNLGHGIYDEIHGVMCGCGQKGCFESYVAGPAISRQGQEAMDAGRSPVLKELSQMAGTHVTTRMVFEAEAKNDEAAKQIIAEQIRKLGISLSSMINLLDLEMIVMGGGVLKGAQDFLDRVDRRVRGFLMTVEAKRDLKIVRESFDNSALIGAAATVFIENNILKI